MSYPIYHTRSLVLASQERLNDVSTITQGLLVLAYHAYMSKRSSRTRVESLRPLLERTRTLLQEAEIPEFYRFGSILEEMFSSYTIVDTCDDLTLLLERVKQWNASDLRQDVGMAPKLISLLDAARRASVGSNSAFREIELNIGIFRNRALTQLFTSEHKPDKEKLTEKGEDLRDVVQRLGGEGFDLDPDERKAAKAMNEDLYKDFLTIRKGIIDQAKEYARNWVRTYGDDDSLVDYQAMLAEISKYFDIHNYPSGFIGKVDDLGRLYTRGGKLIQGVPSGGSIVMNPQYNEEKDDEHVFKSRARHAVSDTWHYTMDFKSRATRSKFEKVEALGSNLKLLRKKWRKLLKDIPSDPDDRTLAAMVLEIVYQTQARIGADINRTKVDGKYQKTFGITTLRMSHLRIKGNTLVLSYKGKKAMPQKHVLDPSEGRTVRNVVDVLRKWKESRGPSDPVFMTQKGRKITGTTVNAFLRKIGAPSGVTIHKFRHLKGSTMMDDIIAEHPFKERDPPASTTQVQRWLRKEAETIGAQLGHFSGEKITGATAISAYVSPASLIRLYREARVAPHPTLLSLVGIDPKTVSRTLEF